MGITRERFLEEALKLAGVPYIWAGKTEKGLDCSGLVTLSIKNAGGPDLRAYHNCQRLWDEFLSTREPKPGDLAIYGRKDDKGHVRATHVMILMPDGRVWGACGGDSSTKTIELAKARGARVRYRAKPEYRIDLAGWRSIDHLTY